MTRRKVLIIAFAVVALILLCSCDDKTLCPNNKPPVSVPEPSGNYIDNSRMILWDFKCFVCVNYFRLR